MGAWDYLKYLAGIKPTVRKPLDFEPTSPEEMARLTTSTEAVPSGPSFEADPQRFKADLASMSIAPEEVEFLTRSQEKRDAAVREATLPVPKSWFNQNIAPLARRIGPGLGGMVMGGLAAGPPGAIIGGIAGGVAGSETAQDEEELARRRAESDLPQAYGTPAYQALLQQIQEGRQERSPEASAIEGALNALPLGTIREARFIPRLLKEAGRGAAIGTGATALLRPLDVSGQVAPGGERGDMASLKELGWSGAVGGTLGGAFGALGALMDRGNFGPAPPSLSEQWADLRGTGIPVPPRTYGFTEDLARHDRGGVSARPKEGPDTPPFWRPMAWREGEEPPRQARAFMETREAGVVPIDARNPQPWYEDLEAIWQNEQRKDAPAVAPPDTSAAPTPPTPGVRRAKGPRLSAAEKSAIVAQHEQAIQTDIANGRGEAANAKVAALEQLKAQWKAEGAAAPEGGTVATGGRLLKPSPGVEEERQLADLFTEGAAPEPAAPKPAAELPASGITQGDVDQLLGGRAGQPAAPTAPAKPDWLHDLTPKVPTHRQAYFPDEMVDPLLQARNMQELQQNLAGAAARYSIAAKSGDIAGAKLEQELFWRIKNQIDNPQPLTQPVGEPTPPAEGGAATPQAPQAAPAPPAAPPIAATARPPAEPPAPLGGEPVMPKVGLTHDTPETLGGGALQPDLPVLPPDEQMGVPPIYPNDTPELQRLLRGANWDINEAGSLRPPTSRDLALRERHLLAQEIAQSPEGEGKSYKDILDLLNEQDRRMAAPPPSPDRPPGFVYDSATSPEPGVVQPPLKPAAGAGAASPPGATPRAPEPPSPAGTAPSAVQTASKAPAPAPAPPAAPAQPSWKPKPTQPIPREGAVVPLTPMAGEAERIAILDPRVLGLDPANYQFKKSDATGSTGKLEGARAWATKTDPLTGKKTPNTPAILVHRRADGTLWVADGHQRFGLYKRLWAEGKELLPLEAEVLDEANGWTIEKVRRLASLRNIGEGTASPLDIAKLIRSGGALTPDESAMISKTSQVGLDYRKGEELAKLGDDAFQVVINEEIPLDHAVYVPKYLSNPESQLLAVKLVGQAKLKSMEEAEAMVLTLRDKMLKAQEDGAQLGMDDLFGSRSDTKLRASIAAQTSLVKAVQSELRTNKGLFSSLLRNKERAESVGANSLDYEANKAISEETKTLLFHWAKYRDAYGSNTNRALSNLSMEIANGRIKKADATQRVLDALRQDITTGGTATGDATVGPSPVAARERPDGAGGVPAVHEPTGIVQPEPAAAPVAETKPPVAQVVPQRDVPPPPKAEVVPDMEQQDIFGAPLPKPKPKPQDITEIVEPPAAEGGVPRATQEAPTQTQTPTTPPVQSAGTPSTASSTSSPVQPPTSPAKPQSVGEMFPRTYEQATTEEYTAMRRARNAAMDAANQRGMRDRVLNENKIANDKFTEGGPEAVIQHWQDLQAEIEQSPVTSELGPPNWIPGDIGEYISSPELGSVTVRFNVPKPSAEARAFLKAVPPGGKKPMFRYDRDTGNWYGDILGHDNNRDPRTGELKGYPQDALEAAARKALNIAEGETAPAAPKPPAPAPAAEAPKGAAVKMMLTVDERQQLADLGYSRADIDGMKPDEGAAIIAAGTTKPLSPPVDVQTDIGIEPTLPGMAEGVGAKPAAAPPVAEVPFALTGERGTGEPLPVDQPLPIEPPTTRTVKPQNVEEILGAIPPKRKPAPPPPPLEPEVREFIQLRKDLEAGKDINPDDYPNLTAAQQDRISKAVVRTEKARKWAAQYQQTQEVTITPRQIQQAVALADQAEHYFAQLTERVPNKPDVPASLTPQEAAAGVTPGVPQRTSARQIFRAPEGVPSRIENLQASAERAWNRGDFETWTRKQKEMSDITFGVGLRNQQPGEKGTNIEAFGLQSLYEQSGLDTLFQKHPQAFWSLWSSIVGGGVGAATDEEDRMRGFVRGVMGGLAASSLASPNVRAEAMRMGRAVAKINAKKEELTGKVALRSTPDPLKDMSRFQMFRPGFFEKNAPEAFARYLKVMDEYNYTAHYGGLAEMPQPVQQFAAKKAIRRVVEELRGYAKEIEATQPVRAAYVREGADALAKKPTNLQRAVKEVLSPLKEVDNEFIERNLGTNIYRVLTGYAVSTALQNLTQPILALRHVQLKDLAWAYGVARTDWAKSITKHIDIHRPMDLAEEAGIAITKRKPEATGWRKWVEPQTMLMESDKHNRRVVYLAAMKQAERRGLMGAYQGEWAQAVANKTFSEAFRSEGDKWARQVMRGTQGEVGPLGFNPVWRGPIGGSVKPFMKFPTLLLGNLIDTFTQPDKSGRNRFVLAMMTMIGAGLSVGLDFEDLLLMGSRPMGIDITDPEKTIKNWATGGQFPAVRAMKDLAAHAGGTANHKLVPNPLHPDEYLQSDLSYLLAGRYPTQLAQAMQRTYVSDIRPTMEGKERTLHMKRTASGAPNPITAGEELSNLLGIKTKRQTERAGFFEDASRLTYEENQKERQYSQDMRRRIQHAIDVGNTKRLGQLAGEYNAHKRNSKAAGAVIGAAYKDRYQRLWSASSPKVRAELARQFGENIAATEAGREP